MKLSIDWLSDYVDLSGISVEELAEKLTMGAFEVEEIERVGAEITGDVVVGEIVEINPHPNADKIRVTKTRLAEGEEPREIVCGAWNIEVGHRIPVALPGSCVINRHDGTPLEIKQSKIRGVTSNGMLCSPPELGIPGGGEGILLLDKSTKLGIDVKELLGLKPDYVLHVEPRSNRGDALSVIGMAREVAALLQRPLKEPKWELPQASESVSVPLKIERTDDCPFFSVRTITGLKIGPSPEWMSKRLEAIGMRSVNNVVDVTNYVMHELGQPLHAYDLKILNGPALEVRRGKAGEKLVTIDERERNLTDEVMVIADAGGVVGVAGVMGGKGSEISDATVDVALEAACFNHARVRRSSRLLGLSSDSSLRFERGVDLASVRKASDRAAYLLVAHCGGKLGQFTTAGDDKVAPVVVEMRLSELDRLIELKMEPKQAADLIAPLGFKTVSVDAEKIKVEVPSFRQRDVSREIDLIEEVTRLYGYDKVPVSMPLQTIAPPPQDPTVSSIKAALCASGLNEAWISSLVANSDLNGRGSFEADTSRAVRVLNPLSEEHQVLRLSLIPGLLKAVAYNQDHGQQGVWLYEVGLTYEKVPGAPVSKKETGTAERLKVSGVISGHNGLGRWQSSGGQESSATHDFFLLKGVIENLMDKLKVDKGSLSFVRTDTPGWFHPGRSASIVLEQKRDKKAGKEAGQLVLGWIGEIHPLVVEAYGLKKSAFVFELDVENFKAGISGRAFQEIPNTPTVVRDISVDLDTSVEHAKAQTCISRAAGKMLKKVELVSVFDLSDNKRSLSYRLTYQHPETTLTADEVEQNLEKVRGSLTKELSASFRT